MDGIQCTIDTLAKTFSTRMAAFEEELHKISPAETPSINTIAADFKRLQSFVVASLGDIRKQLSYLTLECDNMEMRSRRNMLLFHGVPETKEEDAVKVVMCIAGEHLRSIGLQHEQLSRAHRMGRTSSTRPRPILVHFSSVQVRDEAWYSKSCLKGTGITVSEFLTGRRHRLFMAAREKLGISKCWTSGGRIVALGPNGKRHSIVSTEDLDQIPANTQARVVDVCPGKPTYGEKTKIVSAPKSARVKRDTARK